MGLLTDFRITVMEQNLGVYGVHIYQNNKTLAYCDPDFEFIGVVDSTHKIETNHLDLYFQFARKRPIDVEKVKSTMKGPKFKLRADNYVFRKVI